MIISYVGAINDWEGASRGVRRSRASLHFNTFRRRRWLVVQLVSAPLEDPQEDAGHAANRCVETRGQRAVSLQRLVDDYSTSLFVRRCF